MKLTIEFTLETTDPDSKIQQEFMLSIKKQLEQIRTWTEIQSEACEALVKAPKDQETQYLEIIQNAETKIKALGGIV